MAKIAFLALTEDMIKQAKSVVENIKQDVEMKIVSPETAVAEARISIEAGASVIIARGSIASSISEKTDIPVVEIVLTGQEIGKLIYKAKEIFRKQSPVIAIIGTSNMFSPTKVFDELLDVIVKEYFVKRREDIGSAVQKAVEDKVDFIIGGEVVNSYAKKWGIPTLFLKSTEDSIREAFRIAEKVLYTSELEKRNTAEFKTILNYSFDGIIKLNNEGAIVVANYVAEKILNKSSVDLIGKHITEVIETLDGDMIASVLREGKEIYSNLLHKENLALVSNIAPIVIDNKIEGAIWSFQEFRKIEKLEAEIRKELYAKGYIARSTLRDIISRSSEMEKLKDLAKLYAKYDSPVLIIGESGIGKKMFAQSIHNESLRKNNPFVVVDCASMPPDQLDKKLYGYLESNYLHASTITKKGSFDIAHTGTIFLSQISELDKYGQVNLLRVLNESCVIRRGDDKMLPVNVRIICSTNKNLVTLIKEGKFNEDLYYMLNVLNLNIRPLRMRRDDILALVDAFIKEYNNIYKKYIILTEGAKAVICSYPWYGNVRQLKKFCEKIIILAPKKILNEECINEHLELYSSNYEDDKYDILSKEKKIVVYQSYEATKIIELLDKYNGSRQKVAEELNISKTTLWRKIKKYKIENRFNL